MYAESFSHDTNGSGFIVLGYQFITDGRGSVECKIGSSEIANTGVLIRSVDEAHEYTGALSHAEDVAWWNKKTSSKVWSHERLKEAVRGALAWAKDPPEDLGGGFSHHGIDSAGLVIASGRPVRLSFNPGLKMFCAYEESLPCSGDWSFEPYDADILRRLIEGEVGSGLKDGWNGDRSTTWDIEVDDRVKKAFVGGWGPFDGQSPEGWR